MSNNPLISVVTPTYNRADYLGEAIESVLAQTYQHFEMLVVDDGSTDQTPELMRRFASDSRIRYFQQENQGQSVARNRGIEESKGEFICFLDSDNAWLPDKLESSLAHLKAHPEADVVYGDCITIDEVGKEISRKNMKRHSGNITAKLLKDNFVSMNTTMTRSELIKAVGGFNPADRYAEDYGLWLRVSSRGSFLYVPEYWAYYRIMDDQISSDKVRRLYANQEVIEDFLCNWEHGLSDSEVREGRLAFYDRKARALSANGDTLSAFRTGRSHLALSPVSVRAWRT
ncbi:MAG: glycosyltransferase, partial [Ectothiorhodospiraceae bacterium]|nr:glycosyltransferase [Ectothiorhodospiraceae bacterium]